MTGIPTPHELWTAALGGSSAEAWRAYLIVEESDGPDWRLLEAHPTLDAAFAAAEAYMTTDRSHGGNPYTWVHVIEQSGTEVLHDWVFDEFTATWVSADRGARSTTTELTPAGFDPRPRTVSAVGAHHLVSVTDDTRAIIATALDTFTRAACICLGDWTRADASEHEPYCPRYRREGARR